MLLDCPLFFFLLSSSSLRLNGGLMEADSEYEKHLSEETAKLQRLYGGGDLGSFPQFTFTGERELYTTHYRAVSEAEKSLCNVLKALN